MLLCADSDHRLDLHGAHGEEEAPVGGSVQPQCSGAGWSSTGDGQHAQSPTRGKTHMTHRLRDEGVGWDLSTAGMCSLSHCEIA